MYVLKTIKNKTQKKITDHEKGFSVFLLTLYISE